MSLVEAAGLGVLFGGVMGLYAIAYWNARRCEGRHAWKKQGQRCGKVEGAE